MWANHHHLYGNRCERVGLFGKAGHTFLVRYPGDLIYLITTEGQRDLDATIDIHYIPPPPLLHYTLRGSNMTGLLVSAFNAFHRWCQGTALLYLRIKDDLRAGRRVAEQDGERCESGHRACLRIGAADRDYVRNCADRDDVRCLRIGTTSDELGIYEWDAGAGRTTNIKDLRSGRVASGRPSNYLRIYERDACETPCPFYYGCNRRRTATRSGPDDGFCDGRFTRSKRWLMWSWTTCFV